MNIQIRPARHEDIDDIQTVATQAWHSAHEPIVGAAVVEAFLAEYYDTASFRSRIDHDLIMLDVAENSDELILGYVMANPSRDDERTFYLNQIYVCPDHWGNGIGQRLLSHIERKISQNGGERIELGVMAQNERAVNFYKESGYEFEEEAYDDRVGTLSHTYVKTVL